MSAVEDLKKARDAWIHQKENNLTDARIADNSIKVLDSAIEIVQAYAEKDTKTKKEEASS